MKRALSALALLLIAPGCSVKTLDDVVQPGISNACQADAECGPGAVCSEQVCFATHGTIDDVMLEIVPDSVSEVGGLSYLSQQSGLSSGERVTHVVPLPPTVRIKSGQVQLDAESIPPIGCPYQAVGTQMQSIAARIEFTRVATLKGVPILGIPTMSVQTATTATDGDLARGSTFDTSLVPGTYDVYVQPASNATCAIPPRLLKNVFLPPSLPTAPGKEPTADPSLAPAKLTLPTPKSLHGTVQRSGGSLVNWEVRVVEPEQGRVISTMARLGDTTNGSPTNFEILYQPVESAPGGVSPEGTIAPPLIQIMPPEGTAAPTVLWDLSVADLDGDGRVSLDMSGIPEEHELVRTTGQVQGDAGTGLAATVQFFSSTISGSMGLTATYFQSVTAAADGSFEVRLFPGQYRVIAVPDQSASLPAPGNDSLPEPLAWGVTDTQWDITSEANQIHDLPLFRKRRIEGIGGVALDGPAMGATLEAIPSLRPDSMTVLRSALAQAPVVPQNASSLLGADGIFALSVDPGTFDLRLRSPVSSDYAWWVAPSNLISPDPVDTPIMLRNVELSIPVPLEGIIHDPENVPLRNAVVRAYAVAPSGKTATEVGDTRTDEMGHFNLWLPAGFAMAPVVESSQ
jgi:hypothetical protein